MRIVDLFPWILMLLIFVPLFRNPLSIGICYNCEVEENVEDSIPVPLQIQNTFGFEGCVQEDELVRKLPQGFIHKTTNYYLHNISTSLEKVSIFT
jgi:hypothetical protein